MENKQKIGLISLIMLSIGSMIGAGVFNIPGDMAKSASAGGILIGWFITGIGIISLALVFQYLAKSRPGINGGIYGYAKDGFGDFAGFTIGWGYWLSAILANIAFFKSLFEAISGFETFSFFKEFSDPQTWIAASIILWIYNFLIVGGVRNAAFVNFVTTVCKLIPIVVFIIIAILIFNVDHFSLDFWGKETLFDDSGNSVSVLDQVKNTMLITLWVFVGVEGVVVLSSKAKKMSEVAKATVIGLLATLTLYVLVSVLSLGTMSHAKLMGLENPSMATLLEDAVGPWAATMVSIGLIISISGALLGWTLIAAEIPLQASKDKLFPAFCAKENRKGSPVGAVYVTTIVSQIFILLAAGIESSYLTLITIATAAILVPYLSSAAYGTKLAFGSEKVKAKISTKILSIISLIYAVWILYAAGWKYFLLVMILYAVGIPFYLLAKKERKEKPFRALELLVAILLVVLALVAVWLLATGKFDINNM